VCASCTEWKPVVAIVAAAAADVYVAFSILLVSKLAFVFGMCVSVELGRVYGLTMSTLLALPLQQHFLDT